MNQDQDKENEQEKQCCNTCDDCDNCNDCCGCGEDHIKPEDDILNYIDIGAMNKLPHEIEQENKPQIQANKQYERTQDDSDNTNQIEKIQKQIKQQKQKLFLLITFLILLWSVLITKGKKLFK